MLDAGLTGLDGVQTTEMLAEYAPQAGVILMSMESGSELFRRAMLAGAREVLQKPFAGDDLVAAIHRVHAFQARKRAAQAVRQPERGGPPAPDGARRRDGRMITIVSGKGGVGKSIIATNLALVLNRPHPGSVVLVDLSLQFGDIAALLAMTPDGSIAEFAASDAGMTDRHVIQQALSLGPQGLTVLAAPPSPELADYVTTAHLRSLVAELRSTFELVVADTTSQLSEITLEALENSDHIVLVTDFSVTSVKNTRLIMSVIGVLQVDPERIVVVANHRDAPARRRHGSRPHRGLPPPPGRGRDPPRRDRDRRIGQLGRSRRDRRPLHPRHRRLRASRVGAHRRRRARIRRRATRQEAQPPPPRLRPGLNRGRREPRRRRRRPGQRS